MNFDYESIKNKQNSDNGSQWTSYSDLFMGLAFLFLLLYVVASFRTGVVNHSAANKVVEVEQKYQELQRQLKVYERVANNYAQQDADPEERELYSKVIEKLELLEDESKKKQEALEKELDEQKKREKELNEYQLTVKNLIQANLNASSDVKKRETKMAERAKELIELEERLEQKKIELTQQSESLTQTQSQLQASMRREEKTQKLVVEKEQKISATREEYESRLAELDQESRAKLEKLQEEYRQQQAEIKERTKELTQARQTINEQAQENNRLISLLENAQDQAKQEMAKLEAQYQATLSEAESEYRNSLNEERMSAQEKIEAERAYRAAVEAEKSKYEGEMQKLAGKLDENAQKLGSLQKKQAELEGQNTSLSEKLASAQGSAEQLQQKLAANLQEQAKMKEALEKAQEQVNRRKNIGAKIADSFRNSGLDVAINPETGDVILNFGDEYFDTGKYFLKAGMREILNSAVPLYAYAIFEDPEISKYIAAVEIIGFASPTYRGKVVDPRSLAAKNQAALNYNLDLSYKRARAIFQYIFNTSRLQFPHQKQMLPLVKVTGRSFFTSDISGKDSFDLDLERFCLEYDCNKSQKVLIRFNLQD